VRLVAWNLLHGGGERIPRLVDALVSHEPDMAGSRGARMPQLRMLMSEAAARDFHTASLGDALTLRLRYRDGTERYERAAVPWIARLIAGRPRIHSSKIKLAAAGFREALQTERGAGALRACPFSLVEVNDERLLYRRGRYLVDLNFGSVERRLEVGSPASSTESSSGIRCVPAFGGVGLESPE
jgi:hypothetical protein